MKKIILVILLWLVQVAATAQKSECVSKKFDEIYKKIGTMASIDTTEKRAYNLQKEYQELLNYTKNKLELLMAAKVNSRQLQLGHDFIDTLKFPKKIDEEIGKIEIKTWDYINLAEEISTKKDLTLNVKKAQKKLIKFREKISKSKDFAEILIVWKELETIKGEIEFNNKLSEVKELYLICKKNLKNLLEDTKDTTDKEYKKLLIEFYCQ